MPLVLSDFSRKNARTRWWCWPPKFSPRRIRCALFFRGFSKSLLPRLSEFRKKKSPCRKKVRHHRLHPGMASWGEYANRTQNLESWYLIWNVARRLLAVKIKFGLKVWSFHDLKKSLLLRIKSTSFDHQCLLFIKTFKVSIIAVENARRISKLHSSISAQFQFQIVFCVLNKSGSFQSGRNFQKLCLAKTGSYLYHVMRYTRAEF